MAAPLDYKKTEKALYQPAPTPSLIEVPEMLFIMVDGRGDPNTSEAYASAIEVLYGLSYAIKMSNKDGSQPEGYFEYVVPPLEGLWALDDGGAFKGNGKPLLDKGAFVWTALIRQPEFMTQEAFAAAKTKLAKKKPKLDTSVARLESFAEGLCAQILHIGPYDDEPATILQLEEFIAESGYRPDMAGSRRHHEIYLGDPRKTSPEKLKTVIRHPIAARN
jgi:hypothetical protein